MIMRRALFIVCFTAAFAGLASPAHAERTIWQILFPYMVPQEEKLAPQESFKAPFPTWSKPKESSGNVLVDLYDNGPIETAGLDKPHRSPEQLADFLSKGISEILSVKVETYNNHLAILKRGMNETAWNDYQAFITRSQTLESLKANKMEMTAFTEQQPLLLNEGVVGGRYRWLFEVPVTLSFVPEGASSYDRFKPYNQYVIVTLQLGRVRFGEGADELMVESFKITKNPARP